MHWELVNAGTSSLLHSSLSLHFVSVAVSFLLCFCVGVLLLLLLLSLYGRYRIAGFLSQKLHYDHLEAKVCSLSLLFPFSFGVNQSCVLYMAVIMPVL